MIQTPLTVKTASHPVCVIWPLDLDNSTRSKPIMSLAASHFTKVYLVKTASKTSTVQGC